MLNIIYVCERAISKYMNWMNRCTRFSCWQFAKKERSFFHEVRILIHKQGSQGSDIRLHILILIICWLLSPYQITLDKTVYHKERIKNRWTDWRISNNIEQTMQHFTIQYSTIQSTVQHFLSYSHSLFHLCLDMF